MDRKQIQQLLNTLLTNLYSALLVIKYLLLSCTSLPELCLGHKDRKKLHEFEEKCVQAYFHEKSEGLHSSQINQIRATAERLV